MAATSRVLQEHLPCEPPPGLHEANVSHSRAANTGATGGRRQRDRGSQNKNNNSTGFKDNGRFAKSTDMNGDDSARRVFQPYHSLSVPKKRDLEVSFGGTQAMTTVMLRNIPNKYTQTSLLQEIDCMGFLDTYNFFYLPMDIHNRTNVGYAFINFNTPANMQSFVELFTDYKFKRHQSQKIARVSPAHIQGFLENVCHFSSCAVTRSRNSQYRPVVVYHGQLRDLAEILLELSVSSAPSRHTTATDRLLAPEVLKSLESGVYSSRPNAGLNPTAAEFVPAPYPAQEAAWAPPGLSNLDPCAAEFVPQVPACNGPAVVKPILGTAPPTEQFKFQTQLGDASFSMAKKGLEEAVSMWLAGAKTDTQSTEGGDSGAGSGSITPRSASDKEVQSETLVANRLGA